MILSDNVAMLFQGFPGSVGKTGTPGMRGVNVSELADVSLLLMLLINDNEQMNYDDDAAW